MSCARFVRRCIHTTERVQVELHGQYSVERLQAFGQYCDTASYWRVALVLLLVPMPCLVVIVLVDSIPLTDPALGLAHSALFWLRSALVSFFVSFMVLEQCRHYVPKLRMTFVLVLAMALSATAATTVTEIGMAYTIGYPVPFTIVASVPARLTLLGVWFYLKWGQAFRDDPTITKQLVTYVWGLMAQTSLTMIYPAFNGIFLHLDSTGQAVLTMALSVLKVAAKNWICYAYRHLEDRKPEMVIFNVELFHALFLAVCMQSSRSGYMLVLLVVVDYVQAGLSMVDITNALRCIAAAHSSVCSDVALAFVNSRGCKTPVESALDLLRTDEQLCRHPSLVVASRRPAPLDSLASNTGEQLQRKCDGAVVPMTLKLSYASQQVAVAACGSSTTATVKNDSSEGQYDSTSNPVAWGSTTAVMQASASADAVDALAHKPEFVRQVLRLLYLTEFVIAIASTEVVIPIIYSAYIVASYNLPNRRFYAQFTTSTDADHIKDNIENVMRYAALELLSFGIVSVVVWWRVQFSTLRQLAFVFERQWPLAQTKIVVWVLFTVQLPLYHFGSDSSFEFKWLTDNRV